MAASASTEDPWRRLVGEEEGEVVVPGRHADSDTDTDEYYNRHSPSEYDDEADSSRRAATSVVVVPANNGSKSSVARALGWGGTGKRGRTELGAMSVSPSAETDHVHQSMSVMAAAAPNPVLQPVPLAFAPPSIPPASSSVPTVSAARTNHFGQSSSAQSAHDDAVGSLTAEGAAIPPADAAAVHHHLVAPPPRPAPAAGRQNPDGYTCRKCGMWFGTHQGLGGHIVGHKHRERELLLAVPGGYDDDAKRRERVHVSVSPSAATDHVHQSTMAFMAAAAPKPVLQPVPLAFAPPSILSASSSVPTASAARTNLSDKSSSARSVHDDTVGTVVAGSGGASRSSPPAQAATHHQPVAPPPPRPRPAPAAGRQNPDGYTCGKCGMWFATHQGLGGHMVGHKHRERELLLAAPGGRDDAAKRRERVHVCGECGAEFATGVQLGGHKRKHWAGAPIVPKKKPRAVVVQPLPPPAGPAPAADLVLMSLPLPIRTDEAAPPAVEPAMETTPKPATRSLVPGRVRLFGVDIVPAVQTPPAQQGSIACVCEEDLRVQIGCLG